ncbi:peptidoglycan-binding protein [Methylobacterium sp. JK268]
MISFLTCEESYKTLWTSLTIRPDRLAEAEKQAARILQGKASYQAVEARTGVPWWFVGLCHYREANLNFGRYLGNGQPLGQVTTIVPKGRGPFTGPAAFLDGAVDALKLQGFAGAKDWSIARVLYRLEGFNGYGYRFRGVNSPYLWGGSTAYGPPAPGGKYIRDHVFDPTVVDTQLGTAVILRAMADKDGTIAIGAETPAGLTATEPDDDLADTILWVQQALNQLGASPPLVEDGVSGRNTKTALAQFQVRRGLPETGLADDQTVAALRTALRPAGTTETDALRKRIEDIERLVASRAGGPVVVHSSPVPQPLPQMPLEILTLIDKLAAILNTVGPGAIPGAGLGAGQTGAGTPPLGQVNGALGETIGNLLNGKKTAIGIIGAVLTQILSQVPAGTGLGQVLTQLTPAAGLSPYTLPIFLGLAAWGVLGKMEKWQQSPPQPAK